MSMYAAIILLLNFQIKGCALPSNNFYLHLKLVIFFRVISNDMVIAAELAKNKHKNKLFSHQIIFCRFAPFFVIQVFETKVENYWGNIRQDCRKIDLAPLT